MDNSGIQAIFKSFASGHSEMDGRQFAKMMKDVNLVDKKKFTATDVDLTFAKVKDKSQRKITYKQFLAALDIIAKKKGESCEDVVHTIETAKGPKYNGTKADFVKFHDDKSLYTGVYANGGPTNVDFGTGAKIYDISHLCDRTGADVRGVKKA